MKIVVVGIGYVGLSNAVLLAQHNTVVAVDLDQEKVDKINNRISPLKDKELEHYLAEVELDLVATTDGDKYIQQADYVIVATPTDYDTESNHFDTSSVDSVIAKTLQLNSEALIVIKSTVPVGFTKEARSRFNTENILFSPEFLREGQALYDNLYPSRIIVGEKSERAQRLASLYENGAIREGVETLLVNSTEAEAVKLFSNTYLAMRVAYFNELDTYSELHGLNTREVIGGVGLDPRIGNHYNNPSFGYGGYCLPKDTRQLLANYNDVPNNLIEAIVKANSTRKDFVADRIINSKAKNVGIYRLVMKSGADNYRESAIQGVIARLKKKKINVYVFEPEIFETVYAGCEVVVSFSQFVEKCDLIVANRMNKQLEKYIDKVYTRDVFCEN